MNCILSTRDPPQNKRSTQKKWRDGKNIPSKQIWEKARIAILISEKIDFKTKAIKRDTEGHYVILKGITHQEDITLL